MPDAIIRNTREKGTVRAGVESERGQSMGQSTISDSSHLCRFRAFYLGVCLRLYRARATLK